MTLSGDCNVCGVEAAGKMDEVTQNTTKRIFITEIQFSGCFLLILNRLNLESCVSGPCQAG